MPRTKKPDWPEETSDSETEPTLLDIAKALKTLTSSVTCVKNALDTQIAKHDHEVEAQEANLNELKNELKDTKADLATAAKRMDEFDSFNKAQVVKIQKPEQARPRLY